MPEKMSISVNGQSQVPPGFRFHPTEEELLQYYLRKKVSYEKIDLDVIRDVDLNKLEPWDIQEKCKIGTTPQNDWYFFSHKDKKYPTGTRTNRATAAGFWKATGRDKVIYSNGGRIGMRKTLVFYKGRAPHGQKSDWIMHEYRLDDNISITTTTSPSPSTNMDTMMTMMDNNNNGGQEEGWVVCRIFKKKNHLKTLDTTSPSDARRSSCHVYNDDDEGALEHILDQITSCKEENQSSYNNTNSNNNPRFSMDSNNYFLKLPSLESPKSNNNNNNGYNNNHNHHHHHHSVVIPEMDPSFSAVHHQAEAVASNGGGLANWAALDRLVASQLNGQKLDCFNDPIMGYCTNDVVQELQLPTLRSSSSSTSAHRGGNYVAPPAQDYTTTTTEIDLWAFARSASSDPLCHVSNTSL